MAMGMPMGAPAAGGAAPAAGGAAPAAAADAAPTKTDFDVKIESFDAANKIKVIKEVRAATGLGLKEAKDLVRLTMSNRDRIQPARALYGRSRGPLVWAQYAITARLAHALRLNVVPQVEGVPAFVKKGLKKEEAEALKAKLAEVGAKVSGGRRCRSDAGHSFSQLFHGASTRARMDVTNVRNQWSEAPDLPQVTVA